VILFSSLRKILNFNESFDLQSICYPEMNLIMIYYWMIVWLPGGYNKWEAGGQGRYYNLVAQRA
jgi:hypothetical protein